MKSDGYKFLFAFVFVFVLTGGQRAYHKVRLEVLKDQTIDGIIYPAKEFILMPVWNDVTEKILLIGIILSIRK